MRFDCAGSLEMYVCDLGCSRSGLILGRAQARTKCLSAFYFLPSLVTSSLLLLPKSSTRYVASDHSEISTCVSTMRRLAHCLRRRFGSRHFPVNFRMKWLLQNLDMRFDCLVKF